MMKNFSLPDDITGGQIAVNQNVTPIYERIFETHLANLFGVGAAFDDVDLDALQITPQTEVKETPAIVTICGQRVLSRGDVSAIVGAAKSRKTLFVSAICREVLQFNMDNLIRPDEVQPRVLYIDTEQSTLHAKRTYDRITRDFTDDERARLNYIPLREYSPLQRLKITGKAIDNYRPDLVIIDGLTDLQPNVNALEESAAIVGAFMAIATGYNCHICNVIHTTAQNTQKARGHLGSELERKCESVILVERDNTTDEENTRSRVKALHTRNKSFLELTIEHTETGYLLNTAQPRNASKSETKENILKIAIIDLIQYAPDLDKDGEDLPINSVTFKQAIKEGYTTITGNKIDDRQLLKIINFAVDNGQITSTGNKGKATQYIIKNWRQYNE